jgi:hypothetical protein
MAEIIYDEVYLGIGATIGAYVFIPSPIANAPLPNSGTLPIWEPLPFSPVQLGTPTFTYSNHTMTIPQGSFQSWKTVTNASMQFDAPVKHASEA